MSGEWREFNPALEQEAHREAFTRLARALLSGAEGEGAAEALDEAMDALPELPAEASVALLRLHTAALVLRDLVERAWPLRLRGERLEFCIPAGAEISGDASLMVEKERVRRQLLVARDQQLGEEATRRFVYKMERQVLHRLEAGEPRYASIFSLMRDGRELAAGLERARRGEVGLEAVIDPYLQIVEPEATCAHTGLALQDIWRYFRHTWSSSYKSTPGRTMALLIRDRAAPNHPVIGIAAISSAAVQLTARDEWVGWAAESFPMRPGAEGARDVYRWEPSDELARWADETCAGAVEEILKDDLLRGADEWALLNAPTPALIARLREEGAEARRAHERGGLSEEHKGLKGSPEDAFLGLARTKLFQSKRALTLADLLEARAALRACWGDKPDAAGLARLWGSASGRRAFQIILRRAKADKVGVCIADINICGAVPPYTHLLGGKLVGLLLMSAEVTAAYRARYEGAHNHIASGMAGRPLTRAPELVLLGTTSLYGPSSQYNRLKVPVEAVGAAPIEGEGALQYRLLGKTRGYGTDQFSPATVEALQLFAIRATELHRVKSIFGEGVNPRLRKIRDALTLLGLPADQLLRHGSRRALYGVALATNFRRYLLGLDEAPRYALPQAAPEASTAALARYWRERWLAPRARQEEVLARVRAEALTRPIRHGARVSTPPPVGAARGQRAFSFFGDD